MYKVILQNELNSRRIKSEQTNHLKHFVYKDVVLYVYLNYRIFILHMSSQVTPRE